MTKNQTLKRAQALRQQGFSFRAIEAKLTKSLGLTKPGNGTTAFRLLAKAVQRSRTENTLRLVRKVA